MTTADPEMQVLHSVPTPENTGQSCIAAGEHGVYVGHYNAAEVTRYELGAIPIQTTSTYIGHNFRGVGQLALAPAAALLFAVFWDDNGESDLVALDDETLEFRFTVARELTNSDLGKNTERDPYCSCLEALTVCGQELVVANNKDWTVRMLSFAGELLRQFPIPGSAEDSDRYFLSLCSVEDRIYMLRRPYSSTASSCQLHVLTSNGYVLQTFQTAGHCMCPFRGNLVLAVNTTDYSDATTLAQSGASQEDVAHARELARSSKLITLRIG